MPLGPKRAPGRYDVPVSKGAPGCMVNSGWWVLARMNVPMKAMSYFSSSLARQGQYGRRPKVEMPEKTESAWSWSAKIVCCLGSSKYLCSSIARYRTSSIVPQAFVWSSNWVLPVVTVRESKSCRAQNGKRLVQHCSY